MKKLLTATALLATVTSPALAQQEWRLSVAGGPSYASNPSKDDNGEMELDSGTALQLVAHKFQKGNRDGARLYYEFLYAQNSIDVDVEAGSDSYDSSIAAKHFQIGGTYEWAENPKVFDPYFAMTIGGSHYSPDSSDSETYLSGSLALGTRFWVMDQLAIRLDARVFGTVIDSSTTIFCQNNSCFIGIDGSLWLQQQLTAGVTWAF
ncbi:outer membrane beta-barrel protein [Agaribacterium haliotis]|uniref:outer membrane beta-barrel protein n=1 Tax=Agaribacterium haliotis TaxID=2013869 RepID=UPI000BB54FE3|nr:outer membrane beta-barrel protein [Agaribacterium haliotis]